MWPKYIMLSGVMGLGMLGAAMLAEIYLGHMPTKTAAERAAQAEDVGAAIGLGKCFDGRVWSARSDGSCHEEDASTAMQGQWLSTSPTPDHADATTVCEQYPQSDMMICRINDGRVPPRLPYCDEVHNTIPEISVLCAMRDQPMTITPTPLPHCEDGYELVLQVPSMRPMCAKELKEPK
jgi:hypothetical protein